MFSMIITGWLLVKFRYNVGPYFYKFEISNVLNKYNFWGIIDYRCFALSPVILFAGKVLLMLGEVQFELQKLVDNYVSAHRHVVDCSIAFHILLPKCVHPDIALLLFILQRSNIFLTITNPSESLLNELRTVEVCSRQFYMFSLYLRSFYIIPICRYRSYCYSWGVLD